MAAGRLPAPGTTYGPCDEPCQHTDCAQTRQQAESACTLCGQPIGYETLFFQVPPDKFHSCHARCLSRLLREQEEGNQS